MRRTVIALTAATLAAGAGLALAAPAAAFPAPNVLLTPAQQWVQAFERPSADSPCIPPAWLDIPWQADWPVEENVWTPSWEEWANDGTGGFTCTRTITWAPAHYGVVRVFG